jgi:hypothetical protein
MLAPESNDKDVKRRGLLKEGHPTAQPHRE